MTAALETLRHAASITLPPLPMGWQVVTYAALADGSLAILGTDVDLRAEHRRGSDGAPGAGDPFRLARRATARLWTFDGHALAEGPTFPMASPSLRVDRFPDGRWLVVRTRSDVDCGERIFAPGGAILGSVYLGDGIEHLKIDDDGRIWVGWCDEGVFGNSSWQIPGRDAPPSAAGVACFDEQGGLLHQAEQTEPLIADCYALNVAGTAAWACTYMSFPITALGSGPQRRWATSLAGVRAIAVAGDHVLAAGGYGEEDNRLTLLKLNGEGEEAGTLCEGRLPFFPEKRYPDVHPYLDGRRDLLHLVDGGIWHRWSVQDFLTA
ncbi:hypothetical protein [Sphingobium nicotianae]|uniref:Uncharacterized protein n=1 Tax=Sphingobium nicotianae TaxID=2782607 RepID=A0A9X1DBG2_9SPHN|nr:hypothetical protein [Sphingobium nicotianae]MBT2186862.1 hypothetical protein [Sphingobium nicotianae]